MPDAGLFLVSIGPGYAEHMTPAAVQALEVSDAIVGYTMYLDSDKEECLKKIREFGSKANNLYEFLKEEGAEKYWRDEGFEWKGEFLLHQESENFTILNDYLSRQ